MAIQPFLRKIVEVVKSRKYTSLAVLLSVLGFLLSVFCWDCFGLEPELGVLNQTYPLSSFDFYGYTGPLFLLVPFLKVFGESLFVVRFVSSVLSGLTVFLVFLVGRELFDGFTGVLGSVFAVLMPFVVLVKHSEYVYVMFWSVLSFYCFVRFLREGSVFWGGLCGLVFGLGVYQKFTVAYVVISLGVAGLFWLDEPLGFFRENWRSSVVLVLLFVLASSHIYYSSFSDDGYGDFESFGSLDTLGIGTPSEHISLFGERLEHLDRILFPREKVFDVLKNNFGGGEYVEVRQYPDTMGLFLFLLIASYGFIIFEGSKEGKGLVLFSILVLLLLTVVPRWDPNAPMPSHNLISVTPLFLLIFSAGLTRAKKVFKYGVPVLLILIVYLFSLNVLAYQDFYEHMSDESWVEEKFAEDAPIHQRVREINYGEREDIRFNSFPISTSPTEITRGFCDLDVIKDEYGKGNTVQTADCDLQKMDVECGKDKMITLPYFSEEGEHSKVFNDRMCRNPEIEETTCFKPYIRFFEEVEKGNLDVKNKQFLHDTSGFPAYAKIEFKKLC